MSRSLRVARRQRARHLLAAAALLTGLVSGCGPAAPLGAPAEPRSLATEQAQPTEPSRTRLRLVPGPVFGTNYSHVAYPQCRMDGGGILAGHGGQETRNAVVRHLQVMRARGVQSLRMIVWHMHDPSRHRWGVVSSAGGRLDDTRRANLVHYLTAVREAGFPRLTLTFSPQWTNSPFEPNYDRGLLDENWSFLRDVRALAVAHGPEDVRFDLLNEGAASDYLPAEKSQNLRHYVATVYDRYVRTYGATDVTVSTIAAISPTDRGNRLRNLIRTLRSTGRPLPKWFDIHLNLDPANVVHGLQDSVQVLAAEGLSQPLVIGEAPYDDAAVARRLVGVRAMRRVQELLQWVDRPDETCAASPPYSVSNYRYTLLQRHPLLPGSVG